MDPAGIFATSVGWRIMAPSTPYDYVGMMNAALAIEVQVLVLEHVDLYGTEGDIPVGDSTTRSRSAARLFRRAGRDVTVLTYLSMVSHSLEVIEQTGIDAELIHLRFLSTLVSPTGRRSASRSGRRTRCSSWSRAASARRTAAGSPTRSSDATSSLA